MTRHYRDVEIFSKKLLVLSALLIEEEENQKDINIAGELNLTPMFIWEQKVMINPVARFVKLQGYFYVNCEPFLPNTRPNNEVYGHRL